MRGLDFSSSRPDLKKAKALGYGFVVRYLFPPPKGATKAEATAIRAAGLGLVVIYESYAGRAKEGYAAGIADGKMALAFARNIGFPETRPIYFAVDFDATAAQQSVIDAYLLGAAFAIGAERVGVYGSFGVIERCYMPGSARWYWQTYAWSGGKVSAHAHLLQYSNGIAVAGANVDLNESRQLDFGAWTPVTAPVATKPVIIPPKPPVKPVVIKPTIHIMTGAELLAMVKHVSAIHIMTPAEMLTWMKNLVRK